MTIHQALALIQERHKRHSDALSQLRLGENKLHEIALAKERLDECQTIFHVLVTQAMAVAQEKS
jgi:hypothetical protein